MIATRVLSVITALFGLVVLYFAIRQLIDDGAVFPVAYLIESTVLCLTALQALTALCWLARDSTEELILAALVVLINVAVGASLLLNEPFLAVAVALFGSMTFVHFATVVRFLNEKLKGKTWHINKLSTVGRHITKFEPRRGLCFYACETINCAFKWKINLIAVFTAIYGFSLFVSGERYGATLLLVAALEDAILVEFLLREEKEENLLTISMIFINLTVTVAVLCSHHLFLLAAFVSGPQTLLFALAIVRFVYEKYRAVTFVVTRKSAVATGGYGDIETAAMGPHIGEVWNSRLPMFVP